MELKEIFDEIIRSAKEDCSQIYFPEIVDTPTGSKQEYDGNKKIFDHIFIDQKSGVCEDDYYGSIYYPYNGKYIKVGFSC